MKTYKLGSPGSSVVLCTPNAGGLGSNPGQGPRCHMQQLKSSHTTTKRLHMPQLRPSTAK